MKKDRIVIFDLDGTLVDSRADLISSTNRMRAFYKLKPLNKDQIMSFVGDGNIKLIERALFDHETDLKEAYTVFSDIYTKHILDETKPYSGTLDALKKINDLGYKMAVVSNKNENFTKIICDQLDLTNFFEVILGGDSTTNMKPHPEPLILTMEKTLTTNEGSWMIGDNHTDIASGNSANLNTCFCTFGFGNLKSNNCTLKVASLTEFSNYLEVNREI
jgi:phosphoglycolate phosphatase